MTDYSKLLDGRTAGDLLASAVPRYLTDEQLADEERRARGAGQEERAAAVGEELDWRLRKAAFQAAVLRGERVQPPLRVVPPDVRDLSRDDYLAARRQLMPHATPLYSRSKPKPPGGSGGNGGNPPPRAA